LDSRIRDAAGACERKEYIMCGGVVEGLLAATDPVLDTGYRAFVGAGPGDAGLLIERGDVLVHGGQQQSQRPPVAADQRLRTVLWFAHQTRVTALI
jgi:hypothetical protein